MFFVLDYRTDNNNQSNSSLSQPVTSSSNEVLPSRSSQDVVPKPSKPSDLIYENDNLKLYVQKASHLQEKKFRLQDHMYHLLIQPKKNQMPLLSDILTFLQMAFLYILNNIKQFYKPSDENIAFMTIYQSSMVNSLNSGGFLLQGDTSSSDMVNLMLGMLNQYLISHKSLQLDKTFKVYLKILSVNHSKLKKIQKPKKKTKHLGCGQDLFIAKWAIDVPQSISLFKDKCIYLCTVLAIAQHNYFETNYKDKTFLYMVSIKSTCNTKQKHALQLISRDLEKLLNDTNYNESLGTTEILETLSDQLKCQFFIFEGSLKSNNKIFLQIPATFDCSLKPIFLYKPYNTNHVIFIRNINLYFNFNGKTCLLCKKYFKSSSYNHFCKQIKNNSCFACHRMYQKPTTFIHSDLQKKFCNSKLVSDLNTKCKLCNLTMYSKQCEMGHRKLCNSRGFFGFKCDICNHFTYRTGSNDSSTIKNRHQCKVTINCKFCHKPKEDNHLCQLSLEKYPNYNTRLAFLVLEMVENEPFSAIFYTETLLRGNFNNVLITDCLELDNKFSPENLMYDYFENVPIEMDKKKFKELKKQKQTDDLRLLKRRSVTKEDNFEKQFISYILQEFKVDTTVIVLETEYFEMVTIFGSPHLL